MITDPKTKRLWQLAQQLIDILSEPASPQREENLRVHCQETGALGVRLDFDDLAKYQPVFPKKGASVRSTEAKI